MFSAVKAWQKPVNVDPWRVFRPLHAENMAEPRGWRLVLLRLEQSFRLMVGVRDYQTYLRHMQQCQPHKTPMTSREFHRYCLEARFPGKSGATDKCPC